MQTQPTPKAPASPEILTRDMTLSHKDAQAGSPADMSVGGEEDPGAALESLVVTEETSAEKAGKIPQ